MTGHRILVVDDDDSVTTSLALLLEQAGLRTACAAAPAAALALLEQGGFALVLQDMNYSRGTSGEEGLALLAEIKRRRPDLPVILITAWGSIELAVAGMKAGAADFITKPWSHAQILQAVRTALGLADSRRRAATAPTATRAGLDAAFDFAGVIGESPRFVQALELLGRVSGTDASILITGESGTGKEVLAEAVHRNSPRRHGPFVKVNLGGLPAPLFESEMFGHLRGAFTDAYRDREGRFALADGGTIFLDEIGDLDPRSQVKLLRVLQDRTYEPLGASESRVLDVRVISATNRPLPRLVAEGQFREDLFYRLNLIHVHLPSLAERRDDIPLLARSLLARAAGAHGREPPGISAAAVRWLQAQDWPGNVRQLKHAVERALLTSQAPVLEPKHLQAAADEGGGGPSRDRLPPVGAMTMEDIERSMILKSLEHHGGNLTRVAEALGLSRAALYRRLEKYGIRT